MKKRILTLLAAVCLLSAVLSGCGGGSQNGTTGTTDQTDNNGATDAVTARAAAGELNVGIAQDLDSSLDPHKTVKAGTREVMFNVFDGLLKPDSTGDLKPALAESYTVSEDHLLYTFKLRAGVKFHNGQEVTPEDVIWSYQRCGDANAPADIIQVAAFANVEMYQEGDDTVCFQLQEPNNEFASYLTTAVLPKDYTEQDTAPVGTGPFKFVSWELGGDVVLEAFEDYWGGAPAVKRVIFRTIPEALNRTIGLETGEVDLAYDLGITDLESLADNASVTTLTSPSTTVWYVGMNVQKAPFDNEKVRQAVAYALDPQGYIDLVFSGEATPANYTMLPPSVDGYVSDCSDYSCNVEKAKELLAEAGYPDGFSTTLWCSDTQVMRDSAVVIQEQLRQVEINAEVKTLESGQFQSETGNGAHDMFIMSKTSIDPDSMLRSMYHTEALGPSGNRCFWTTPEVDALIDEASTTTDTEHAMELYAEIQSKVAEAAPLVPMAVEHLNAGMQSNVKGFGLYPGKSHYINGTYFE